MKSSPPRRAALALGACLLIASGVIVSHRVTASDDTARSSVDPILAPGALCTIAPAGQPALLRHLVVARTETAPFQPVPPQPALGQAPRLYTDLGALRFRVTTRNPKAQAYFNQGLRLAFAFNHAEAQRAFREAQKLDPRCAMCFWGEALVLGPNINAPMLPQAHGAVMDALAHARALADDASERERALIAALDARHAADPAAERGPLDRAYADAMKEVARRFPKDDTVKVLYAEAVMDTQPWDYWEAGGSKPKGNAAELIGALEEVLDRNPGHPGAVHLYIHAMEASTQVEKALPHALRLARLMPGAGHIVHMPAHIYYRLGMYRESLEANKRAMAVDERYFQSSPSDPMYRLAYYPHNIHFAMVSALMGGDRVTAIEAASRLDAAVPGEAARKFAALQSIKAAPYTTHAHFSDADAILGLGAPPDDLVLVKALYHYSRAVAHALRKDAAAAKAEIDAIAKIGREADFKAFDEWGVPGKEIVETARLVASARLADSQGDLEGAAKAYEEAIFIEDALAYTEPPHWYYPVRQSLGAVRLRQGRLDDAEKAFRDSLARVRNNGWALAGLAETYRRKGDGRSERPVRAALARAWFGEKSGPELGRL
jgi:tetratricopeptide (TPR) repeat protein